MLSVREEERFPAPVAGSKQRLWGVGLRSQGANGGLKVQIKHQQHGTGLKPEGAKFDKLSPSVTPRKFAEPYFQLLSSKMSKEKQKQGKILE